MKRLLTVAVFGATCVLAYVVSQSARSAVQKEPLTQPTVKKYEQDVTSALGRERDAVQKLLKNTSRASAKPRPT